MKVAPLHKEFIKFGNITHLICHTGQHYDVNMSKIFFEELELPKPDFYLGVGSGSHGLQTGKVMIEFEKVLINEKPDLVIVVGDVNSTLACSLAAVKLNIKVAHIEAGLRSFDKSMPEEINRILSDAVSDYLFVTEDSGIKNLKKEGIKEKNIHFVGNVMIDSLRHYIKKSNNNILKKYYLRRKDYILVTMHRPATVDNNDKLMELIELLLHFSDFKKIIFPVHPRTKKNIIRLISKISRNLIFSEPLGYLDFIALMKNAELVITDSGGIQEETTFLGVQCVTVRDNTERPVTINVGTNHLAGTNFTNVRKIISAILNGKIKKGKIPELWDGMASSRIIKVLRNKL